MARSFTANDSKKLIKRHNDLLAQLREVAGSEDYYREQVKKCSNELVNHELIKILQTIPVDEVNMNKSGIRIKALKDSGFNTIADIAAATPSNLASVKGISLDTANIIKQVEKYIVNKAAQGVKIKLTTDDKNQKATNLVRALLQYRSSTWLAENARQLLNNNSESINNKAKELSSISGTFKWIFLSRDKKQRAQDLYNELANLYNGSYGEEARKRANEAGMVSRYSDELAWKEFEKNSVRFFNDLEAINPGVLGNDDSVYGLPEELALEIQNECFFPDGLLCELRRYQEWGVKYALHQERVLLGDEMGLGKTIQAIAAMVSLRNTGATHFVVVCPASVITNWCREIKKMSRLSVTKVHGAGKKQAVQDWMKYGGVAVTTYETTGAFELPFDFRFTMLVVDEAHYVKNPEAIRSKNVKALSQHADRQLYMTGTALENKVDEMISLISQLQPNVANRVKNMAFMSSAPQFRKAVSSVYYRRKREDVLTELPELIESKEWCVMNPHEWLAYENCFRNKSYVAARRVSWNVDNMKLSSKATRLKEIVEEAESEGRKVIVFSFFLDTIQKVIEVLGERCTRPINGSVTPQRRQQIIDEFEKSETQTVLVAQIQAGGTGLNIQAASVVVICEPQLKPSIENQAISRAYRMGQTRNVLVYRLLCEDSIDERITERLEEKQAEFNAFADESEAANESREIDQSTFGDIIREEIERINERNGN